MTYGLPSRSDGARCDSGLAPLRRHFRVRPGEFAVGPGWYRLVRRCHDAVVAEFPDYELLAVKQKYAVLAFQAFPRPWRPGGDWTTDESERLDDLVQSYQDASAEVCERCGDSGTLRTQRPIWLTLCAGCDLVVRPDAAF